MRRIFGEESSVFGRLKRLPYAVPARRARPASVAFNTFKTLVQAFWMWLIFLGIGPVCVWKFETFLLQRGLALARFPGSLALSIPLFVAGWFVAWASAWALIRWGEGTPLPFDATNKLVVRGPYLWVRNPMACASLLQGAAVGLFLGSPLVLAYIALGALLWNFLARPWEERDLEGQFGDDYRAYKRAVRCWWPRLPPFSLPLQSEVATNGQSVEFDSKS